MQKYLIFHLKWCFRAWKMTYFLLSFNIGIILSFFKLFEFCIKTTNNKCSCTLRLVSIKFAKYSEQPPIVVSAWENITKITHRLARIRSLTILSAVVARAETWIVSQRVITPRPVQTRVSQTLVNILLAVGSLEAGGGAVAAVGVHQVVTRRVVLARPARAVVDVVLAVGAVVARYAHTLVVLEYSYMFHQYYT